jgi:MoaA/NifB/PqqE/SkfB family radical SAM enzyme/pimeloyl-ACP methyl ester carboxylesterase
LTVTPGVLLIHGYTGSPLDIAPLKASFEAMPGPVEVSAVLLPGHGDRVPPAFDPEGFVAAIGSEAERFRRAGREIVIVGHSTGGILALSAIAGYAIVPRLLVLASVPNRIDGSHFERWRLHSPGKSDISLTSIARMLSTTNRVGSETRNGRYPVLIVHGERDELVPVEDAFAWRKRFSGPVRTVVVPGAGHDLFVEDHGGFAVDVIRRSADDALHTLSDVERETLRRLAAAEPSAARFLARSPHSARHLANSPGARALRGDPFEPGAFADTEPVFANIEITTRCNLRCAFCARTSVRREERDMAPDRFGRLLDLLPHAWRVTLAGLGEPLLHPRVADFVSEASSRGRRVTLATNAVLLSAEMSRRLIGAGLDAIVFSLDAVDAGPASAVRAGAAVETSIENIRTFAAVSSETRPVARAVFSAVSSSTVPHLERLVETVAGLGVDALMLSDLNFPANLSHTVRENIDEGTRATVHRAVRKAFSLRLPVLSVTGLEEFAPAARYREHLLIPPARLYQRQKKRRFCHSPWQTLPVDVDGTATLCDCRPGEPVGNVLDQPFGDLWNGSRMRDHRKRMLGDPPPGACAACPRF